MRKYFFLADYKRRVGRCTIATTFKKFFRNADKHFFTRRVKYFLWPFAGWTFIFSFYFILFLFCTWGRHGLPRVRCEWALWQCNLNLKNYIRWSSGRVYKVDKGHGRCQRWYPRHIMLKPCIPYTTPTPCLHGETIAVNETTARHFRIAWIVHVTDNAYSTGYSKSVLNIQHVCTKSQSSYLIDRWDQSNA